MVRADLLLKELANELDAHEAEKAAQAERVAREPRRRDSADDDPPPSCRFIYFIRCDATGLIKIGTSRKPELRLRDLQIGSPTPLRILCTISTEGENSELQLHRRFAASNSHGEWFHSTDDLLALIREHGGEV